eukprot:1159717-Pelagomonas_calceolata.AAC.8
MALEGGLLHYRSHTHTHTHTHEHTHIPHPPSSFCPDPSHGSGHAFSAMRPSHEQWQSDW